MSTSTFVAFGGYCGVISSRNSEPKKKKWPNFAPAYNILRSPNPNPNPNPYPNPNMTNMTNMANMVQGFEESESDSKMPEVTPNQTP